MGKRGFDTVAVQSGESSTFCGVDNRTNSERSSEHQGHQTPTSGETAGQIYAIGGIDHLNGGILKVCVSPRPRPDAPQMVSARHNSKNSQ